ncbi:MAG: SRPBCC family protein [Nitrososphaerota archaeon]|nr:SRPBCC family protein [Nitrososphaerota archaeon]MDG6966888.1 SRPBCC family protein [Nitrososphaerota archaeon]MDG7021975.1 SRPBCC family protein [Nitrososphaerota archaeon]
MKISRSREMSAGVDKVWDVFSDLGSDPKYWSQIRDIEVKKVEGNTVERDATVGPRAFSHRSHQVIVLEPKKTIRLTLTGAPMEGVRTITFVPVGKGSTRVDVEWDLELKDVPGFVQAIVKGQIGKTTEEALERISEEVAG